MAHRFTCRVYYEDTDMAGIVYHANYLKYVERARSEWVRALGVDQRALKEGAGVVFAVRALQADFLRPARLDDELTVTTALDGADAVRGARLRLRQEVWRGGDCLFTATLTLICMTLRGRAVRFPDDFRQQIASWGENPPV
ncbi:tol-pal system-associated acyl-CoA thioesterase [Roseicitreum antarcticum]|uniref:tol-pal system-associated acyl-CoA thioesterase n=1 Tax=Roseicitreum antarcticum TaxID=564137 RepID=UPI000B8747FA|nr:tol-pal system-associated acyl-CoA thioesterase [Roseicitreum antarcticum]